METENFSQLKELIKASETRVTKAVFPATTNHYHTLFGGTAMQWMDEIAFITATRFTRKRVVTVSTEKVDFKMPIPAGSIVELVGNVKKVGKTSLTIGVNVYLEHMYESGRELALHGEFTFVALGEDKKPIEVI